MKEEVHSFLTLEDYSSFVQKLDLDNVAKFYTTYVPQRGFYVVINYF